MEEKYLTHRECVRRRFVRPAPVPFMEFERFSENVLEDGRLLTKTIFKQVDPRKRYDGLKCSDFALESLIAVGDVANLRDVTYPTPQSVLDDSVSQLDAYGEKLSNMTPKESKVEQSEESTPES